MNADDFPTPAADVAERHSVRLLAGAVGAVLANVEFATLGPNGTAGSVVGVEQRALGVDGLWFPVAASLLVAGVVALDVRRDLTGGLRRVLLALGFLAVRLLPVG
ncbi:hypothetical protein [Halostella salina]|uniref:hypothetical protein n=1 Tax=Halostella salina TaxID=1547897 RepID=UPI0013CE5819|nr:hypothetical protein [Halostella salina]